MCAGQRVSGARYGMAEVRQNRFLSLFMSWAGPYQNGKWYVNGGLSWAQMLLAFEVVGRPTPRWDGRRH